MSITFKLGNSRRYLGLVTLEIAAADEVDKKGVLKTIYCILKIFSAPLGETRKTCIGVLIHTICPRAVKPRAEGMVREEKSAPQRYETSTDKSF